VCASTLFHIFFWLMVAIFDSRLIPTAYSIHTSPIVFQDLDKHVCRRWNCAVSCTATARSCLITLLISTLELWLPFCFPVVEKYHQFYIIEVPLGNFPWSEDNNEDSNAPRPQTTQKTLDEQRELMKLHSKGHDTDSVYIYYETSKNLSLTLFIIYDYKTSGFNSPISSK